MTYIVSSGTLNPTIPYLLLTCCLFSACMQLCVVHLGLGLWSGFVLVLVLWLVVEEGWAEESQFNFSNFISTLQ